MWERIRGRWIEGKIQNLLMVLRHNKDNLVIEDNSKLILDCCLWYVKRWKLTKIGMKGIIDIEFENGKVVVIKYFPKKRPLVLNPGEKQQVVYLSTLIEEIMGYEQEK